MQNNKTIEVKTARKGRTNNTFQFNGINPKYNYDYLLCIGICEEQVLYRIFHKTAIKYIHSERKYYMQEDNFKKQLVQMNPENMVNYKLTLNIRDMLSIDKLPKVIESICYVD